MANTFALNPTKGVVFVRQPGLLIVTVTIGSSYATASGGLTIDFTTVLAQTGLPNTLDFNTALPFAFGFTSLGWRADLTKTSTSGTYTCRLWNGITEAADGATTGTLIAFLPFA